MGVIKKKILATIIVCSLMAGIIALPTQPEAKSVYWLSGVSKMADGQMRMYYKGNAITLQGTVKKSASKKTVYDAVEKKYSHTLKVAANCKVTNVEADNVQTITYKKWAKNSKYKKGAEVTFIGATLKIDGGKITRIYFSA